MHRHRLAGYLRALRKAGIVAEPAFIVPGDFTVEAGQRGAAGMAALLARIEDPNLAGDNIRFKSKLLVRESTAPPLGTSRGHPFSAEQTVA